MPKPKALHVSNEKHLLTSLVPRPSITANAVEDLVKLLRRMTSGGHLEFAGSATPPDVHLMAEGYIFSPPASIEGSQAELDRAGHPRWPARPTQQ